MHPNAFSRELTDDEIESRVVVKELLKLHPVRTKTPKVAFLFMTPGSLPFEKLWHMFFQVCHSIHFLSCLFPRLWLLPFILLVLFMFIIYIATVLFLDKQWFDHAVQVSIWEFSMDRDHLSHKGVSFRVSSI